MTKYRQVQVSFWQDHFVLDLTPEEKYFYLYLMTNPKANQIGIYELPLKMMELETGYNRETVEKLLTRFEEYGKIQYSNVTKEVILLNWVKHNWNTSIKVITRVSQELEKVKSKDFVNLYIEQAEKVETDKSKLQTLYRIDTVSESGKHSDIPYGYKEKEKEKDKENDKDKDKESVGVVFEKYSEFGFGSLNGYIAEQINQWLEKLPADVVVKALEVATNNNKRTMSYVNGILKNWDNEGLNTVDKVDAELTRRKIQTFKNAQSEVDLNTPYEKDLTKKLGF